MRHSLLLAAALVLAAPAAHAAMPVQNPDWPCQQRLVPDASAALFWAGTLPQKADWKSDPRISALVEAIASREVSLDDSKARIEAFAKPLSKAERARVLPLAFIGVIAESNRERHEVIDRIEALTRRQRSLAKIVSKVSAEVDAIPEDAKGAEAAKRTDAVQRRDFVTRSFEETQQTMRYACDVPAQMDARLGGIAQAMQALL